MKPIVCIYAEGNDTKVAVIGKEKDADKLKVFRTATVSGTASPIDVDASATGISLDEGALQLEGMEGEPTSLESDFEGSGIDEIHKQLSGLNLSQHSFIPTLTEPSIYYHLYEGPRSDKPAKR